jgi:hypothetical protein
MQFIACQGFPTLQTKAKDPPHGQAPSPPHLEPFGWSAQSQRIWDDLRTQNPALHDGPIYLVTSPSQPRDPAELTICRSSYRTLCVEQHRLRHGLIGQPRVRLLGVKGLLMIAARDSQDHALPRQLVIGQRSSTSRMYPEMWETIPAGGVEVTDSLAPLTAHNSKPLLLHALAHETLEELSIPLQIHGQPQCLGLLLDDAACSLDIVIQIEMADAMIKLFDKFQGFEDRPSNEHSKLDVIDPQSLATWLSDASDHTISPALRALAPHIRW